MADVPSRSRSALASILGWVIVALIAIWLFGSLIGWIRFVLRSIVWLVAIGVLVAAYLALKTPDD